MKDRRRNRNAWVPVISQLEEEYMGGVEAFAVGTMVVTFILIGISLYDEI